MGEVRFKAVLASKTIISTPLGERMIKMELIEEREMPGPVITARGSQDELIKEIAPIVSQVVRSLTPQARLTIPRLTLYLTEEEWEKIERKPEVGEELTVVIREEEGALIVEIKS